MMSARVLMVRDCDCGECTECQLRKSLRRALECEARYMLALQDVESAILQRMKRTPRARAFLADLLEVLRVAWRAP